MAQEGRIELRLSGGDPEQRVFIDMLESMGEYGVKGRFLKTRLLRGYAALTKEVEAIRSEGDPVAALDRLAQSVNAGHFRAIRTLLAADPAIFAPAAAEVAAPPAAPLISAALQVKGEPQSAAEPREAPDQEVGAPVFAVDASVDEVPPATEIDPDVDSAATALPETEKDAPPRANWGRFKGLAGIKRV